MLAGLVLNVFDFLIHGVWLKADWEAALTALNHPGAMNGSAITVFVLLDFVVGIFGVWLYAAMRPRFGAGPRTAVIAGLALWVLAAVFTASQAQLGLFPNRLLWMPMAIALVQLPLAIVVGAKFYQEGESGSREHAEAMTA